MELPALQHSYTRNGRRAHPSTNAIIFRTTPLGQSPTHADRKKKMENDEVLVSLDQENVMARTSNPRHRNQFACAHPRIHSRLQNVFNKASQINHVGSVLDIHTAVTYTDHGPERLKVSFLCRRVVSAVPFRSNDPQGHSLHRPDA